MGVEAVRLRWPSKRDGVVMDGLLDASRRPNKTPARWNDIASHPADGKSVQTRLVEYELLSLSSGLNCDIKVDHL